MELLQAGFSAELTALSIINIINDVLVILLLILVVIVLDHQSSLIVIISDCMLAQMSQLLRLIYTVPTFGNSKITKNAYFTEFSGRFRAFFSSTVL